MRTHTHRAQNQQQQQQRDEEAGVMNKRGDGGGRRGGAGVAGGETGISQIDEKTLFEVRWSDKCGRKHCGSGVSVGKISSGG